MLSKYAISSAFSGDGEGVPMASCEPSGIGGATKRNAEGKELVSGLLEREEIRKDQDEPAVQGGEKGAR